MWLITDDSFISCVRHRTEQDKILVRARRKECLVKLFPAMEKQIFEDHTADYRWRLLVPEQTLARYMADYICQQLTYDNFKNSQKGKSIDWQSFLNNVWAEGYSILQ